MSQTDKSDDQNLDGVSADAVAPAFLFVPAPFLFVHSEPMPEGMQLTEAQGFAEVTIEGLAPMPLEHLSWGYLADEKCTHMLLFAAARDRLAGQKIAIDESFFHVLPSFYAAAPADGAAHWVFIWEAGHVAGIRYEAGQPVPSRIELERVTAETPAEAFAARDRLTKRLGQTARIDTAHGLLAKPEAERASGDGVRFLFTHYTSAESQPTRIEVEPPLNATSIWTADMRDNVFRVNEQKNRQGRRLCTRILQVAAGFALLLFVGQLLWAGGEIMYKRKLATINVNALPVATIMQNKELLTTIDTFTKEQLRPFEMIGLLNSRRPPAIWFDTIKATGGDTIVATAITNDSSKINDFAESVKSMPGIEDAKATNSRTVGRNTNFSLQTTFKLLPPIEDITNVPPTRVPEPPAQLAGVAGMQQADPNAGFAQGGPQQLQQFPNGQQFQQGGQFQQGPQQFQGTVALQGQQGVQTIQIQGPQGVQTIQFDPNQLQGQQQQFQQGGQFQQGQFQQGGQQFQQGPQQFQGGQPQFQQPLPQQAPGTPQVINNN